MSTRMLALAAAGAWGAATAAQSAPAGLFVYRGAGCTGRAAIGSFDALVGRAPDGVTEFAETGSWQGMRNSIVWAVGCWTGRPGGLSQAVPMLVDGATLKAGAAGAYDREFAALGQALVAGGHPDAFLRIGWEMNGDWYAWSAAANPPLFRAYFRRIVHALRAVPGQRFRIVWNPTIGRQKLAPTYAYPGDAYVDVIGMDVYDQSWRPQDADPATRWSFYLTQPYGLNWLVSFARVHGKPIAVPEWGTGWRSDGHGYADDATFVRNMAAFIAANDVLYHGYWDYNAGDYAGELSTGAQPDAAAAFADAFGGE